MAKTHKEGSHITDKHGPTNTTRHVRICEKRTRGMHKFLKNIGVPILDGSVTICGEHGRELDKSPKNVSTPMPGGTPEYAKTAPEECTN